MERTRLFLAGTAIGITLLVLWHRNAMRDERKRGASDERRLHTKKAAA